MPLPSQPQSAVRRHGRRPEAKRLKRVAANSWICSGALRSFGRMTRHPEIGLFAVKLPGNALTVQVVPASPSEDCGREVALSKTSPPPGTRAEPRWCLARNVTHRQRRGTRWATSCIGKRETWSSPAANTIENDVHAAHAQTTSN
jgi:hypothetical protein